MVARLRGITHTRRIGHSGTLDPMATGVLPVFLGQATRLISLLPDEEKAYRAGFRLGQTTDTQDSTGTVLATSDASVTREALEAVLPRFRGEIRQTPPMYSAVRVNGQRLYDLARQGREVEREARLVTILRLELLCYDAGSRTGELEAECSKGTYIRTLIHDIGQQLGTGGVMTALCRTRACGFSLPECRTLEEVQALADAGALEGSLLPMDRPFSDCPAIRLSAGQARLFRNGARLDLGRLTGWEGEPGLRRVYGPEGDLLGLASPDPADHSLRIEKMLCGGI